jgi:hypothetical protein
VNEKITALTRKCWDSQTDRLDAEKLVELILEDVMSICEDLGDKGMDGHYCVDAIRNKFGLKEKNTWVGLTKAEMDEALNSCDTTDIYKYFRIIEAKLKDKNT